MQPRTITLLGSTGSIGRQTLDIIRNHTHQFKVFALTANTNVKNMLADCLEFKPKYAVMRDAPSGMSLRDQLMACGSSTQVLMGEDALCDVASDSDVDIVMAGIVGAGGLLATMAAANSGKTVLLANKEALVMAGDLFMKAVKENNVTLLPVDSEHNAVFQCWNQCMQEDSSAEVNKVYITASGGPFLDWPSERLNTITPEQAVAHPNWVMGKKISVDSATMVNKGLELIEARYLFNLPDEKIDILLHPQSLVHALVEYIDGSVVTHMGPHDMRVAISHALAWPNRITSGSDRLSALTQATSLSLRPLPEEQYPCLKLAKLVRDEGQCAQIIFNAANEIAVDAFLKNQLRYLDITSVIQETLAKQKRSPVNSIEDVVAVDKETRISAEQVAKYLAKDLANA